MGFGHGISKFFIAWGIKYLIILIACLAILQVPQEKMGLLMLIILIATVVGEVVARVITGGM